MKTKFRHWIFYPSLAGSASAAVLAGAFAFEHIGGLAPCDLCITQRWAHVLVICVALMCGVTRCRMTLLLGVMASCVSVASAAYHVGVEKLWWAGPSSCSGGAGLEGLSGEELLNSILSAPVIRCTDVAWEMFGISMAGWNGIASLFIAALWIAALIAPKRLEDKTAVSSAKDTEAPV